MAASPTASMRARGPGLAFRRRARERVSYAGPIAATSSDPISPGVAIPSAQPPVGFGVIGAGLIGAHHAANLARRVPGARLIAIADPQPGTAETVARAVGCANW